MAIPLLRLLAFVSFLSFLFEVCYIHQTAASGSPDSSFSADNDSPELDYDAIVKSFQHNNPDLTIKTFKNEIRYSCNNQSISIRFEKHEDGSVTVYHAAGYRIAFQPLPFNDHGQYNGSLLLHALLDESCGTNACIFATDITSAEQHICISELQRVHRCKSNAELSSNTSPSKGTEREANSPSINSPAASSFNAARSSSLNRVSSAEFMIDFGPNDPENGGNAQHKPMLISMIKHEMPAILCVMNIPKLRYVICFVLEPGQGRIPSHSRSSSGIISGLAAVNNFTTSMAGGVERSDTSNTDAVGRGGVGRSANDTDNASPTVSRTTPPVVPPNARRSQQNEESAETEDAEPWKLLLYVVGIPMCTITVILGSILFLFSDTKRIDQFNKNIRICIACCDEVHIDQDALNYDSNYSEEEYEGESQSQSHSVSFVSTTSARSSTNTIIPYREGVNNVTCEGEIGTWTRGELLGSGSFGNVFLALCHKRGRMFAVKQVKMLEIHQSTCTMEKIQQFENEIRTISGLLHHKNIVQYLGSCRTPTMMNIYLEFVPGGSLENLIRIYGPLDSDLLQEFANDVVAGLAFLHSHNIIHRDVKGANILIDHTGTCKLADFGGARELMNSASGNAAQSITGTINWMAPEMIKQAGHHKASDIWSLGCTLLELATGQLPWTTHEDDGPKSGFPLMIHIADSTAIPFIPPWLPIECQQLITECLHRNPKQRPSAQQLLMHKFFQLESFDLIIMNQRKIVKIANGQPSRVWDRCSLRNYLQGIKRHYNALRRKMLKECGMYARNKELWAKYQY